MPSLPKLASWPTGMLAVRGQLSSAKPQNRSISTPSAAALAAALLIALSSGCAHWSSNAHDNDGATGLQPPGRSLDSVVIETVLVRFPASKLEQLDTIWTSADESIFDIQFRQLMDRNGLRAGLLFGELPLAIREQIQETSHQQTTDALEHAGLAADVDNQMRKLQCRAARRKDLIVRKQVAEPLTVLTLLDGEKVSGETYYQPSVLFDLRAMPHGDGQATLELTPEIQHGEYRQTFVSSDYGVRPEMKRQHQAWPELRLSARLRPGQILAIAATQPPKALGSAFFTTHTADRSVEHVVLLVRLSETQLDELFAHEEIEQAQVMAER